MGPEITCAADMNTFWAVTQGPADRLASVACHLVPLLALHTQRYMTGSKKLFGLYLEETAEKAVLETGLQGLSWDYGPSATQRPKRGYLLCGHPQGHQGLRTA